LNKTNPTDRSQGGDPDNPELSAAQLRSMKRIASVKRIRWQLRLSQEDFAELFEIPVGTIRDWEQGRSKPDRAAAAYLKVISNDPESVGRALGTKSPPAPGVSMLASKALSNPSSVTVEQVRMLAASILTNRRSATKQRKKA
jgi:putative transcriptional regulator